MFFGLKLLCLLLQLLLTAGIVRQLWHPYRSRRWSLAWGAMLVGSIALVARRVYDLWTITPVMDAVAALLVTGCFLVGLWQFGRLFAAELDPLPPMPHGHIQIDSGSVILAWDRMAEQIFGYRATDQVGQHLCDPDTSILPTQARAAHQEGIQRYLADPQTARVLGAWIPLTARHKNGILFTVELFIAPQTGADGTLTFTAQVRQVFTL